jgi:diacylglycerol kinase (ATP)
LQNYIRLSAINFFKAKPFPFTIESSAGTINTDAFFLSIANSNQFGNNFTIAPEASLHDGLLDIVIVKKMNKFMLPFSILGQITGINAVQNISDHIDNRNIIYFQTDRLKINNPGMAPLHIDGDPVATSDYFEISMEPEAFRLIHPL